MQWVIEVYDNKNMLLSRTVEITSCVGWSLESIVNQLPIYEDGEYKRVSEIKILRIID